MVDRAELRALLRYVRQLERDAAFDISMDDIGLLLAMM